jgi:hypothetical protein
LNETAVTVTETGATGRAPGVGAGAGVGVGVGATGLPLLPEQAATDATRTNSEDTRIRELVRPLIQVPW